MERSVASKAVACWNRSVRSRPVLSAVAREIDPWTFWEISPGASDFLVSDSGLFVRRPLVLASLRSSTFGPMDLLAHPEGFSIILGDALELAFIPNGDSASDPKDSRLGAVLFHFGPRFRGNMHPLLVTESCRG